MMHNPSPSANVRFVLVEPNHPGNVGSTARALKTMGFSALALVAPHCRLDDQARAMASGADDVLAAVRIAESLGEALGDCVFAVAATARPRELSPEVFDARGAASRLATACLQGAVAQVFGNETSGLSNEQIRQCDAVAHIPTNPEYSSLNLAAAVQVFAYELRMALAPGIPAPAGETDAAATRSEVEQLIAHAERALAEIGFHDPHSAKRLMPRLRRLAARARLEREEINILRGMLNWAARAARGPGTP